MGSQERQSVKGQCSRPPQGLRMHCKLPPTLHHEVLLMPSLRFELFMWLHASFPRNLLHVKGKLSWKPLSP